MGAAAILFRAAGRPAVPGQVDFRMVFIGFGGIRTVPNRQKSGAERRRHGYAGGRRRRARTKPKPKKPVPAVSKNT